EGPAHAVVGGETARGARVGRDVAAPYRLAGLPGAAGEALAGREHHVAGALDEIGDARMVDAPRFAEAQHAGVPVDQVHPGAVPALRLADRAHHAFQAGLGALGLGEHPRHGVLHAQAALGALLLGDVD